MDLAPSSSTPKSAAIDQVRKKTVKSPGLRYDPSINFTPRTAYGGHDVQKSLIKLPKLEISTFSGDPLEWPEWSSLLLAKIDRIQIDDSLYMNHLKTLVTGKAKAAIAGLGYTGQMYTIAWDTLTRHFGRPQIIINAQLRQIHSHPPIKPHDSAQIIKYSQIVSNCVNTLTIYNFQRDLSSQSVLNNAVRKLPPELRSKWFIHLTNMGVVDPGLTYFSTWLSNIAFVHDEMN